MALVDGRTAIAHLGLQRPLQSPAAFAQDARGWLAGLQGSTGVGRVIRLLLTIPVLAILLVRVIVMTALEVVVARLLIGVLAGVLAVVVGVLRLARGVIRIAGDALFAVFDAGWNRIVAVYPPALRGAMAVPSVVLLIAVGGFAWSLWQFENLGTELLPTMHQGEFTVRVAMPVGTRLSETSAAVGRLETALSQIDGIERFATTVGVERTEIQASDEGEHTVRIAVRLARSDAPELAERRVMADVRAAASTLAGASTEIDRPTLFTLQTPLEVRVFSDDLRLLRTSSDAVEAQLRSIDALADVRNDLGRGFPEVQVTFDRDRLAALGLTARAVGETIRDQVRGVEPTDIHEEDNSLSIVVRTSPADIPDVEALESLIIRARTADAAEIRLSGVARLELAVGPSEIRHVEGRRAAVVEADVPLTSLSAAADEVKREIRALTLPGGVIATVSGQNVEMERAIESLLFALLLAVFLVYIVLASKFESFRGPLVILLSIPLALVGVVIALTALDIHVSVLVFIGLIMLTGIVVNNAIVLVDYINQLRDRGESLDDAIVHASSIRLRPVLITTLTTILGLGPMALGLGEGAELRQPMGVTVIAGLASATLLTLIVVPVLYRVIMRSR